MFKKRSLLCGQLQVRRIQAEPTSALETEEQTARAGGSDEILPFAPVASTHVTEKLPKFPPPAPRPISAPTEMGNRV